MNTQFIKLILNSDELNQTLCTFYKNMPNYRQANQSYDAILGQVKEAMGFEFFDQMEESIITYWSLQTYAHYLFGLGFRQEILSALLEI